MVNPDFSALAIQCAPILRASGETIFNAWDYQHTIHKKGERDFATEVDREVEEVLRKQLHSLLPEAGFIVEEGKSEKKERYNWVIDPLDGTSKYIHHVPLFYTQIALLREMRPVLGLIYQPVSKQLFSAVRGKGTLLNDKPVRIAESPQLGNSVIDIDFGKHDAYFEDKIACATLLFRSALKTRMSRGALSPYLTTGLIDAYVCVWEDTHPHDIYPRMIVLEEAGATLQRIRFRHIELLIAAKQHLGEAIIAALKKQSGGISLAH